MLTCKQCGRQTSARGAFAMNRSAVLAGAAYLVVPAEDVESPKHLDMAFCGKCCLMEYLSAEADAMLGIGRAVNFRTGDRVPGAKEREAGTPGHAPADPPWGEK